MKIRNENLPDGLREQIEENPRVGDGIGNVQDRQYVGL